MLKTKKLSTFIASLALLAGVFVLSSGSAHATTYTVSGDDMASIDDSNCTLREAIENINAQGQPNADCAAADGNNDTINLPATEILLEADLPTITESITIQGQGVGVSTISGAGAWQILRADSNLTIRSFTLAAPMNFSVLANGNSTTIEQIEVDGTGSATNNTNSGAVVVGSDAADQDVSASINDLHIHSYNLDITQFFPLGINSSARNINASIQNVTVSDITNTGTIQGFFIASGIFDGGVNDTVVTGAASNITINKLLSTAATVLGFTVIVGTQDTNSMSFSLANATIVGLEGSAASQFLSTNEFGSAVSVFGAAANLVTVNIDLTNILFAQNNFSNCSMNNINPIFGVSGTVSTTITSNGGNLSDDNSCTPYFTQPSDQNDVAGLAATLAPLADNGGFVPTMALLQNSPAVDGGVVIAGLTGDARGAVRPQGAAYDSGAYESPFTKPAPAILASTGHSLAAVLAAIAGLFAIPVVIRTASRKLS